MQEATIVERLLEAAKQSGDLIQRQQQVIDILLRAVEPFATYKVSELSAHDLHRAREAKVEAEKLLEQASSDHKGK